MKIHLSASIKSSVLFCFCLAAFISCQRGRGGKKAGKETTKKINLEEITISQLQQGYKQGTFTITDVVKAYLERIKDIDKNGPRLNSIIIINPDALRIAEKMDKEMAAGKSLGPLHGIP